jgi:hypothetical protein
MTQYVIISAHLLVCWTLADGHLSWVVISWLLTIANIYIYIYIFIIFIIWRTYQVEIFMYNKFVTQDLKNILFLIINLTSSISYSICNCVYDMHSKFHLACSSGFMQLPFSSFTSFIKLTNLRKSVAVILGSILSGFSVTYNLHIYVFTWILFLRLE